MTTEVSASQGLQKDRSPLDIDRNREIARAEVLAAFACARRHGVQITASEAFPFLLGWLGISKEEADEILGRAGK